MRAACTLSWGYSLASAQEFVELKERIIMSAISDLGVPVEDFCAACERRIKGKDTQACKLLDMILYLDDFEVCLY